MWRCLRIRHPPGSRSGLDAEVAVYRLRAPVDGLGQRFGRRTAVAGVVFDAEVALGSAGVVAGRQHDAAVGVDGLIYVFSCPERSDDDGHPVLHTSVEVAVQPVVRLVHDLVDGEGS